MAVSEAWRDVPGYGGKYQASDMGRIANTFWHGRRRQNGGHTVLAPDGNYYAWDNTVGVRKAKEDLRALARQEGRLFAPKNWPAT